ncbi:MAG: acyl carrier protein [Lachnospiraceae bacterium]|nr:acyl carrier protein [Lachnospiraceae bacterium]MDE7031442.1 acyl carrier protein [Lachnospiraceae bacterium]
MGRTEIIEKVNTVFRDVFDDDRLLIGEQTTAADVDGWDSLKHISLIEAVEEAFDMRFTMLEINGMKNVGEMITIIEQRVV